jgi:Arc/MetJ family transcription regulator
MKKEYDFSKGKKGAVVPLPRGKTRITIRIDDDVLAWFRKQVHAAGGGNYQTLINRALREHVSRQHEPLEATLRRVLREELARQEDAYERAPRGWLADEESPYGSTAGGKRGRKR